MKFPTELEKYARYFSEQNFKDKILNKAKNLGILKVMGNITPEVKAMAKARVCEIFKLSGEVEISFPEEGGAMDVDEQ